MIHIRPAHIGDSQAIYELIYELAVFEKAPSEMVNTAEHIAADGFGAEPAFICFMAEYDGKVAGMSLCYIRYSTWKGRVLYLEDLVVKEDYRGKGIGKALLGHTLQYARQQGYSRLSWQVLDWNQPAIDFYKKFNAQFDPEWLNAWVEL